MDLIMSAGFAAVGGFLVLRLIKRAAVRRRSGLIDTYRFPQWVSDKVAQTYPHLNEEEVAQVINGLREYFHICNQAGRRMVSMPSQAVDVAWHEFILFTRQYQHFCKKALGRFLHHTPAEAMSSPTIAQKGIKTAWRIACVRQNINWKSPTVLPTLFAIDAALNIPDGFRYELNCKAAALAAGTYPYCASHIGCGGCAGSSGCSGNSDSGGDAGCGGGGGCGGGD